MSDEYLALNKKLHEQNKNYGAKGFKRTKQVYENFIRPFGIKSLLDYGCGKNTLLQSLKVNYGIDGVGYDPAVVQYQTKPPYGSFDGVMNVGMIEHVEPEYLNNVLQDMNDLGNDQAKFLFYIGLVPSNKILEDGRNAHLISEDKNWWIKKLIENSFYVKAGVEEKYLNGDGSKDMRHGFYICVCTKGSQNSEILNTEVTYIDFARENARVLINGEENKTKLNDWFGPLKI